MSSSVSLSVLAAEDNNVYWKITATVFSPVSGLLTTVG